MATPFDLDDGLEEQVLESTPFESKQNDRPAGARDFAAQGHWGDANQSQQAPVNRGANDGTGWGALENNTQASSGVQGFGDSSSIETGGFGQDDVQGSGTQSFGGSQRQFNAPVGGGGSSFRPQRSFQAAQQEQESKYDQGGNVHEFAAMPDITEQEEDITEQYGDAPLVQDNRLKAIRDVERGLGFQLPAAEAGIDLSVLTSVLAPRENIIEDDVPWGWDYLFTQLSSQHHAEQDAREKEEERLAALKQNNPDKGAPASAKQTIQSGGPR